MDEWAHESLIKLVGLLDGCQQSHISQCRALLLSLQSLSMEVKYGPLCSLGCFKFVIEEIHDHLVCSDLSVRAMVLRILRYAISGKDTASSPHLHALAASDLTFTIVTSLERDHDYVAERVEVISFSFSLSLSVLSLAHFYLTLFNYIQILFSRPLTQPLTLSRAIHRTKRLPHTPPHLHYHEQTSVRLSSCFGCMSTLAAFDARRGAPRESSTHWIALNPHQWYRPRSDAHSSSTPSSSPTPRWAASTRTQGRLSSPPSSHWPLRARS